MSILDGEEYFSIKTNSLTFKHSEGTITCDLEDDLILIQSFRNQLKIYSVAESFEMESHELSNFLVF